jgi:hypothetical protein
VKCGPYKAFKGYLMKDFEGKIGHFNFIEVMVKQVS